MSTTVGSGASPCGVKAMTAVQWAKKGRDPEEPDLTIGTPACENCVELGVPADAQCGHFTILGSRFPDYPHWADYRIEGCGQVVPGVPEPINRSYLTFTVSNP